MYYYYLIFIIILLYIEFNTKYVLKKNITIKKGSLIVCSHNYEHKDIFITLQEIKKSNTHRCSSEYNLFFLVLY